MDKKLSEYSRSNGMPYYKSWRDFHENKIPGAYKDSKGRIFVKEQKETLSPVLESTQIPNNQSFITIPASDISLMNTVVPVEASYENSTDKKTSTAATRFNRAPLVPEFNRFGNIEEGFLPFTNGSGGSDSSNLCIRDTIVLTQKAYFNFPIVRNVIDMMTEFSASKIYLTGGNEVSRNFFGAYFDAINLSNFQDRFFREFWRSGNVFIYPLKVKIRKEDVNDWIKEFRLNQAIAAKNISLAMRYIILNPADIEITGSSSFVNSIYYKVLTPYELQALKSPKTPEDQRILDSLPQDIQKSIRKGDNSVMIPLNLNNVYPIFYKKQDYEPFAVPMVFPVLDDINWKAELKKIDKAISRTTQQAVLLINVGYETKDGKFAFNKEMVTAIQAIFTNESVGRVLISDFTTQAKFVIPEIGNILDPKKYQVVNEDIKNGLNDILMGGTTSEKFANQSIKVKVFIGRLLQARETFLNDFLIPEIKRISKLLGFKSYPEPKFEDIDLEDSVEWPRAVTRLGEIGFLTPDEVFNSIETGRLPSKQESEESQVNFKELKDKGYYEPITGGPATQKEITDKQGKFQLQKQAMMPKQNGRPLGAKRPQSTKRVSPMKKTKGEIQFSAIKIKDNIILADKLHKNIDKFLCKKFKLKELNEAQKEVSKGILELVIANEESKNWDKSFEIYADNPVDKNHERVELLNEIAIEHGLDNYLSGILINSIKD